MKTRGIIRRARKKATQSVCKYRVVAVALNKKKEFVGLAVNKPFDEASDQLRNSRHAEEQLISGNPNGIHTILIARIGKGGDFRPIDPCDDCKKLADKYGIRIRRLV